MDFFPLSFSKELIVAVPLVSSLWLHQLDGDLLRSFDSSQTAKHQPLNRRKIVMVTEGNGNGKEKGFVPRLN
jgi:hypothetical protein